MNSIAFRQAHIPQAGNGLLTAAQRLAVRLGEALRQPAGQGNRPRETDAEIRRRLGRDVPAALRRDLGLDPDVL